MSGAYIYKKTFPSSHKHDTSTYNKICHLRIFLLLCLVGVHCGIYKSSYNLSNISYLNSLPPPLSFIPPSPCSWNSFNRYHFYIYTHVYAFLQHIHCPMSFSNHHRLPLVPRPQVRTYFTLLLSNFVEENSKKINKRCFLAKIYFWSCKFSC
jgi:hypothetical protein